MKIVRNIFLLLFLSIFTVSIYSQQDTSKTKKPAEETKKQAEQGEIMHGRFFVDEDGDGFNDNAPDHDGDGIPNGLDPDYKKLMRKLQNRNLPYVDLDGDGINDNLQQGGKRKGMNMRMNENQVKPQSSNSNEDQSSKENNNTRRKGSQRGRK